MDNIQGWLINTTLQNRQLREGVQVLSDTRRISTGTLWMGPGVGVDDGSREGYREGSSEGSPARELLVSSDYPQCQRKITARHDTVDIRHQ